MQCQRCRWGLQRPIGAGPRYVLVCDAPIMLYERIECRDRAIRDACHEFAPKAATTETNDD